ncbi:MAG: hypothetical protein JSS75_03405 [Bacteroidetes bacterium]|nr:hypothetical protein [Bacteroidota bacterium]
MTAGSILELVVFAIGGLALVVTILGFLKNVRGGRKGKYQTSWFEQH